MGDDAPDHGRAPHRPGARRDPGLLRGRPEPGDHGDERLVDGEPAWWLNLLAQPDATVVLADGSRPVRGRAALGEERERLWAGWREMGDDVDGYATLRSTETAVVVLEPKPTPGADPSRG